MLLLEQRANERLLTSARGADRQGDDLSPSGVFRVVKQDVKTFTGSLLRGKVLLKNQVRESEHARPALDQHARPVPYRREDLQRSIR